MRYVYRLPLPTFTYAYTFLSGHFSFETATFSEINKISTSKQSLDERSSGRKPKKSCCEKNDYLLSAKCKENSIKLTQSEMFQWVVHSFVHTIVPPSECSVEYMCVYVHVSCGSFKENIFISWVFALISLSKYKLDGCVCVCALFVCLSFTESEWEKNHHLFASILLLCDDNRVQRLMEKAGGRWILDELYCLLRGIL